MKEYLLPRNMTWEFQDWIPVYTLPIRCKEYTIFFRALRLPCLKMSGTSFTSRSLCILFSTDAWRPWKNKDFSQLSCELKGQHLLITFGFFEEDIRVRSFGVQNICKDIYCSCFALHRHDRITEYRINDVHFSFCMTIHTAQFCGFGHIYWRNPNEKLNFLCSDSLWASGFLWEAFVTLTLQMHSRQDNKFFYIRCFLITVGDKHGIFVSIVMSIKTLRGFLFTILDGSDGLWNSFSIKPCSSKNCGFLLCDPRGTEVKAVHKYVTSYRGEFVNKIDQQERWSSFQSRSYRTYCTHFLWSICCEARRDKWSFGLKISSVNVDKFAGNLFGRLLFLCSERK